jgi:hypothetical protein
MSTLFVRPLEKVLIGIAIKSSHAHSGPLTALMRPSTLEMFHAHCLVATTTRGETLFRALQPRRPRFEILNYWFSCANSALGYGWDGLAVVPR